MFDRFPDDPESEEGDAGLMLRELGFESRHIVCSEDLASALEIPLSPFAPKGCVGWSGKFPDKILVGRGCWAVVQHTGLHEFGHMAKSWGKTPMPHDEHSVNSVLLRIWMPRDPMLDVWRSVGSSMRSLVRVYQTIAIQRGHPPIPQHLVLRRLAQVRHSQIVLRFDRRSQISASLDQPPPQLVDSIEAMVIAVRANGLAASDTEREILAEPYDDGERKGVMVLYPRYTVD